MPEIYESLFWANAVKNGKIERIINIERHDFFLNGIGLGYFSGCKVIQIPNIPKSSKIFCKFL
jgi:hypothetical protein